MIRKCVCIYERLQTMLAYLEVVWFGNDDLYLTRKVQLKITKKSNTILITKKIEVIAIKFFSDKYM